jgi:hypothetical protein
MRLVLTFLGAAVVAFGASNVALGADHRATTAVHTPIACLKAAKLSGVQARAENLWRGYHRQPFFSVVVKQYPTAADAHDAIHPSPYVTSAQANRFVVTAPDRRIVAAVAVCLRQK